jgi:hypothetical protein
MFLARDFCDISNTEISVLIEEICFELKLSKESLIGILGVSRRDFYNWLKCRYINIELKTYRKLKWLNCLAQGLDEDVKGRLWLWKDKPLSSGLTIKETLKGYTTSTKALALEINTLLNKPADPLLITNQTTNKDLTDKSPPFANND